MKNCFLTVMEFGPVAATAPMALTTGASAVGTSAVAAGPIGPPLAQSTQTKAAAPTVRTKFPETWIWADVTLQ